MEAVLSMHQPWASLLVYGLKRIEGRAWPTDHTGSLWIHATSTQPTLKDIEEMQSFYTHIHEAEGRDIMPNLPKTYPTSVLIGCVDVVACYSANDMEAWKTLPDTIKQEIGSPYCFLCENPKRLVVPQQMRGHPKLWQLPGKTANGLSAALKSPPDPMAFSWANYGRPDTADLGEKQQSSRSSIWFEKYGKAKQQQSRKLQSS